MTIAMDLVGGAGTLDAFVMGFNGDGPVEVTVSATVNAGGGTYTQQRHITLEPKAGFVRGANFMSTAEMVNPTNNKGWQATVAAAPTGGGMVATVNNRPADSGGTLTVAHLTSGYTAVSPQPVTGNTLPNAHLVVGTSGINVTSSTANQIYGYSANANTPVTVNSAGAGTYVMAGNITTVNISAPGYYTVCPSSLNVNLYFPVAFTAGNFLSMKVDRPHINLVMENSQVPIPVNDLYLAGTNGLSLAGSLNSAGNITLGGLAPGHPTGGCP